MNYHGFKSQLRMQCGDTSNAIACTMTPDGLEMVWTAGDRHIATFEPKADSIGELLAYLVAPQWRYRKDLHYLERPAPNTRSKGVALGYFYAEAAPPESGITFQLIEKDGVNYAGRGTVTVPVLRKDDLVSFFRQCLEGPEPQDHPVFGL